MLRALTLFVVFSVAAIGAEPFIAPVHVHYQKLGTEDRVIAEMKGKREIDDGNPCVLKMKQDAEEWAKSSEIQEATEVVLKDFPGDHKPRPHLVLQYRNDSMELQYELRTLPERGPDGWIVHPERVVYHKGVLLTTKNANWKERLNKGRCQLTENNFRGLLDELHEADWLQACLKRKMDLLSASKKINNYMHSYVPPAWIEEAKGKLWQQDIQVGQILRENVAVYREGNDTSRNCLKGLDLLEKEAANTVTVLNEIKSAKNDKVVVPGQELTELAARLVPDTDRMPASIRRKR